MPFLASEGCFWPLTASITSEVKHDHTRNLEQIHGSIFFSVECMVWLWCYLFQPLTTSKTIDIDYLGFHWFPWGFLGYKFLTFYHKYCLEKKSSIFCYKYCAVTPKIFLLQWKIKNMVKKLGLTFISSVNQNSFGPNIHKQSRRKVWKYGGASSDVGA